MSDSNASSGGIGFFGLLAILFIGLKLGDVIDWEWWLVLMPLYGPIVMALAVAAVFGITIVIGLAIDKLFGDPGYAGKRRRR